MDEPGFDHRILVTLCSKLFPKLKCTCVVGLGLQFRCACPDLVGFSRCGSRSIGWLHFYFRGTADIRSTPGRAVGLFHPARRYLRGAFLQ